MTLEIASLRHLLVLGQILILELASLRSASSSCVLRLASTMADSCGGVCGPDHESDRNPLCRCHDVHRLFWDHDRYAAYEEQGGAASSRWGAGP